mgnify:FL=1|jgi:hypothetical protein
MTSVTAFNDMMSQFLMELHKTFPEEKGLKKYITAFEMLKETQPKKVVESFMENITPYADKISSRDESFFLADSNTIEFLKPLNITTCWPSASEGTKNAIWQYIQTLYMLGTTITTIPSDTLTMIESVAKQCADKMQSEGDDINEAQLMKSMQGLLGGLMKK